MTNSATKGQSIDVTDETIEAEFEGLGVALCAEEVFFSRETIDDYIQARKNYHEPGFLKISAPDAPGRPWLTIEKARPFNGLLRTDVYVVDFGDMRAVYS